MPRTLFIEAGRMRHKVSVMAERGKSHTSRGQTDPDPTRIATCRAAIEPLRGQESILAHQMYGKAAHRITIRYSDNIPLTEENWLEMNGRKFHIGQLRNIDERNRIWELICTEGE